MYSRLFQSIVHSSVWCEDPETKVVWVTLIALADRRGYVFAALPGLAKAAGVSVAATERAIEKFQSPDPHSGDRQRSPENEGRRIEPIDGGWRLLNYEHYRDLPDADVRRDQVRSAVKAHRERNKTRNQVKSPVIKRNQVKSPVIPSDATTTAAAEALTPNPLKGGEAVTRVFDSYRTLFRKGAIYTLTPKRRQKIASRVDELGEDAVMRAVRMASADNWFRNVCRNNGIEDLLKSRDVAEKWASAGGDEQHTLPECDDLDSGFMGDVDDDEEGEDRG